MAIEPWDSYQLDSEFGYVGVNHGNQFTAVAPNGDIWMLVPEIDLIFLFISGDGGATWVNKGAVDKYTLIVKNGVPSIAYDPGSNEMVIAFWGRTSGYSNFLCISTYDATTQANKSVWYESNTNPSHVMVFPDSSGVYVFYIDAARKVRASFRPTGGAWSNTYQICVSQTANAYGKMRAVKQSNGDIRIFLSRYSSYVYAIGSFRHASGAAYNVWSEEYPLIFTSPTNSDHEPLLVYENGGYTYCFYVSFNWDGVNSSIRRLKLNGINVVSDTLVVDLPNVWYAAKSMASPAILDGSLVLVYPPANANPYASDVYVMTSNDNGDTWSTPELAVEAFGQIGGRDFMPVAAEPFVNDDGNLMIWTYLDAWNTGYESGLPFVLYSPSAPPSVIVVTDSSDIDVTSDSVDVVSHFVGYTSCKILNTIVRIIGNNLWTQRREDDAAWHKR